MQALGRWLSKEDRPLLYPHIQPNKVCHKTFMVKHDKVDGYLRASLSFKVSHDILIKDGLFNIFSINTVIDIYIININTEKHTSYLKTKKLIPT